MVDKTILKEVEQATVLAAAAFMISHYSLHLINNNIGVNSELHGDTLTTSVIEELALSDFQRRLMAKGESK